MCVCMCVCVCLLNVSNRKLNRTEAYQRKGVFFMKDEEQKAAAWWKVTEGCEGAGDDYRKLLGN